MTKILNVFPLFYEIPTDAVLEHRKKFYSTEKELTEPIAEWFCRIRSAIEHCDYGDFSNFLIIDKFFCGLDADAKRWLRKTKAWSADQLVQALVDPKSLIESTDSEGGIAAENRLGIDEILKIELEDVESAASFFNSNTDQSDGSDIDESNRLPDIVKCEEVQSKDSAEINAIEPRNSVCTRAKNAKQKVKSEKPNKNEGKGFTLDAENRYHCVDCGKQFKQKVAYNQHRRLHTGKNLQHCKICNKAFLKPSKLKRHSEKHEREQSVAGKSFECYLCKFQFLRIQGLRIHINLKHVSNVKSSNFQCQHCNGVFTQQTTLDDHLRSEHRLMIPYKCPQCNREFQHDQLAEMKEHLTTHVEIKPFMCEICGNAFRTRKQLNLHMAKHTNERKFKCTECGQMLKSRSNYKTHMRKHTGERPFECALCDKTFVQRANYLKHSRWHTGEKPHACTFCDKRFPTNYDMKLHINSIHTGAKPFECDSCDRKFSQPSTLRVHRLRVHR